MATDPAAREREVADLLDRWPWDMGGVIIGGYAIAAFGAPRYSTDIDIVVSLAAFDAIDKKLADLSDGSTLHRLRVGERRACSPVVTSDKRVWILLFDDREVGYKRMQGAAEKRFITWAGSDRPPRPMLLCCVGQKSSLKAPFFQIKATKVD